MKNNIARFLLLGFSIFALTSCEKIVGCDHKDDNKDHLCDFCGETTSNHSDLDNNHLCDFCGMNISNHVDENKDHLCDICNEAVSEHVDGNNDKICDICGSPFCKHSDIDNNHFCDFCAEKISDHSDLDNNHFCDYCSARLTQHMDSNYDHICDICGVKATEHIDINYDHICEYCGNFTDHSDLNFDHKCDICMSTISYHYDNNGDDICDYCNGSVIVKNLCGGTIDERNAIEKVSTRLLLISGAVSAQPFQIYDVSLDNGDFLCLYNEVITKVNNITYTICVEWDTSKLSPYIESRFSIDKYERIDLKFPTDADVTSTLAISRISCGSAYSDNPEVQYGLNVKVPTIKYERISIADINKLTAEPVDIKNGEYGYDLVDYSSLNPYFKTNNPQLEYRQYYYAIVSGELVYVSPDGNFAILADGDQCIEVYAGSSCSLTSDYFPAIEGKYVEIYGNLGQYRGGIMIGFIIKVKTPSSENIRTASKTFQKIDSSFIDNISTTYLDSHENTVQSHLQCVPGMNLSSALVEVTGTYVPGSLANRDGTSIVSISKYDRFTFKLKIDNAHFFTVAYDYHCDKNGDLGLFDKINRVIANGETVTIKGFLRYVCNDTNPFVQNASNPGDWQLVPCTADQIIFK